MLHGMAVKHYQGCIGQLGDWLMDKIVVTIVVGIFQITNLDMCKINKTKQQVTFYRVFSFSSSLSLEGDTFCTHWDSYASITLFSCQRVDALQLEKRSLTPSTLNQLKYH